MNMFDQTRNKVIQYIESIVQDITISEKIESKIYDTCTQYAKEKQIVQSLENKFFMILYKDRVRSITINLQNENNRFLEKVKNGNINLDNIGRITHQEMDTFIWDDIILKKIERDMQNYNQNTEGVSNIFKCGKCNKRETQYTQVQTRSADEPMTTFVTCVNCGNNWKC